MCYYYSAASAPDASVAAAARFYHHLHRGKGLFDFSSAILTYGCEQFSEDQTLLECLSSTSDRILWSVDGEGETNSLQQQQRHDDNFVEIQQLFLQQNEDLKPCRSNGSEVFDAETAKPTPKQRFAQPYHFPLLSRFQELCFYSAIFLHPALVELLQLTTSLFYKANQALRFFYCKSMVGLIKKLDVQVVLKLKKIFVF